MLVHARTFMFPVEWQSWCMCTISVFLLHGTSELVHLHYIRLSAHTYSHTVCFLVFTSLVLFSFVFMCDVFISVVTFAMSHRPRHVARPFHSTMKHMQQKCPRSSIKSQWRLENMSCCSDIQSCAAQGSSDLCRPLVCVNSCYSKDYVYFLVSILQLLRLHNASWAIEP